MTGTTVAVLVGLVGLVLVIAWDFIQSRRIDRLEKRVQALEKK